MSDKFFDYLFRREAEGQASPAGKLLIAAGFRVWHAGGGCLAWIKEGPSHYALITDGDNDLGDDRPDPEAEEWGVGLYENDLDSWKEVDAKGLTAAIDWVNRALASPTEFLASP